MKKNSTVTLVKIAGMWVLGFFLAFWVYLGLGAMAGGDWSGIGHLIVVALAMAVMALAWKQPLTWGWAILVMGVMFGLIYGLPVPGSQRTPFAVLLMSAPFLLSGILLLLAGQMARRAGVAKS